MTDNHKRYDIIVWGASGFTGRLVAEYLLERYGPGGPDNGNGDSAGDGLNWALGGRNQTKLELVRDELGANAATLPIVTGDSADASSMDALASQTKVICSTVGPYAKYGSELVAACVKHGTDYCDLAGEPQWIRQMIDSHHEAAQESGARIVNSCGFDSVPSDIGVYFLQRYAQQQLGETCRHIKLRVEAIKGGASGGTIASMMNLIEAAREDRSVARILKNPYGLNPEGETAGPDKPDLKSAVFDEDVDAWIAPFIMAAINTRIVRRSHALMNYCYGADFRYDEAVIVGDGIGGRLKAIGAAAGTAGFALGSAFEFTRNLLKKKLPEPGEGPSARQRERGFFKLLLVGKLAGGTIVKARVTGDRDPGYGSTSKMLGESAVCLARDLDDSVAGGVLTPASAMAAPLLTRLTDNAGLTFEVIPPENQ